MSLLNRLNDNFRVQSHGTQILMVAIVIFVIKFLEIRSTSWITGTVLVLIGTILVLAVSWLISFLIIKIFDRNGDYSMHTIWKTLLVIYLVYTVVSWLL